MYFQFLKKQTPAISTEKNETSLSQMPHGTGIGINLPTNLQVKPFMWGFPKMVVANNHGFSYWNLKVIILGCFGGTTI